MVCFHNSYCSDGLSEAALSFIRVVQIVTSDAGLHVIGALIGLKMASISARDLS